MCAKGAEWKLRRWVEEETNAITREGFQAYGRTLEAVTYFKYLGRVPDISSNDWPAVVKNMRQERKMWAWFSEMLVWKGAGAQTSRTFFKAVVKAILLFGSETWVKPPRIIQTIRGFHHRVA